MPSYWCGVSKKNKGNKMKIQQKDSQADNEDDPFKFEKKYLRKVENFEPPS
jgi:hypothetical protein